ncbi:unnamed protein product [Dovyalis caffra]|uniref:MYB-CC type transcription factor LHEQLE-containing domain-containing protein n=1 Tax=Dovyalis caffra TaxID=77055 RepID=A0AAV1SMI2_9ROSI|nr:unnamed protein product [Dovyalis caffra]
MAVMALRAGGSHPSSKERERAALFSQLTLSLASDGLLSFMNDSSMLSPSLEDQIVKQHLQRRIDAQRKYMQTILEKAYRTLPVENWLFDDQEVFWEMGNVENIDSAADLPSIQDFQIYGDHSHEGFLPTDDNMSSCTTSMIWYDYNMQLQNIGTSAPCLDSEEEQLQMANN